MTNISFIIITTNYSINNNLYIRITNRPIYKQYFIDKITNSYKQYVFTDNMSNISSSRCLNLSVGKRMRLQKCMFMCFELLSCHRT